MRHIPVYFQCGSDRFRKILTASGKPAAGGRFYMGTLLTIRMSFTSSREGVIHLKSLKGNPIWFHISNAYCVRFCH